MNHKKNSLAKLVFIVFYSFNIYIFNTWENIKVTNLALVSGMPFLIWVLLKLKDKEINYSKASLYLVFIGLVTSGLGINPSYFISLFIVLIIFALVNLLINGNNKQVKDVLFVSIILVFVNSFWLIPILSYILENVSVYSSIGSIGFSNWVDSLSRNTSIINIFRLQGAWDWYALDESTGLPLFIPYALNYFKRLPFLMYSFLLPGLAFLSLALYKKVDITKYIFFSVLLLTGVFLGIGTHPPTGEVYRILLDKIPFFSLFRSPWYIFTPYVTLAYAGLLGLLVVRLTEYYNKNWFQRSIIQLLGFVLVVGNFLYTYPLVTGKIYRPDRDDSFFVNFPEYILKVGDFLKDGDGRIIGYPGDDLERFSWGYVGTESILSLFSPRETLFSSLNTTNSPISNLITEVYSGIKINKMTSVKSILSKLNVSQMLEKLDQNSLSKRLPENISNQNKTTMGKWNIYELGNTKKISSVQKLFYGFPWDKNDKLIAALPSDEHLINPIDSVFSSISGIDSQIGNIIIAENSAFIEFSRYISETKLSKMVDNRDLSKVFYDLSVPEEGYYQIFLDLYGLESFGINPDQNVVVTINEENKTLVHEYSDDSFMYFKEIHLSKGKHRIMINLLLENLVSGGDFESGQDEVEFANVKDNVEYEIKGDTNYLSIVNRNSQDDKLIFNVNDFDSNIPYHISIDYKQVYGNNAALGYDQTNKKTIFKSQIEGLRNFPEWTSANVFIVPVQSDSEAVVSLIAPSTSDPFGSTIYYDNLVVNKVFTNNLYLKKSKLSNLPIIEIDYNKKSPVEYYATITDATSPHIISFKENYSDIWRIETFDKDGARIDLDPKHFSVDSYANAWYFSDTPKEYSIRITYKRQRLLVLGVWITAFTILGVIFINIRTKNEK